MIIGILLGVLLLAVIGGAIFLHQGGIFICEDTSMMKIALGGFFTLYAVTAIGLKLFLPPVPATQVDIRSVTGFWSEAYAGLEAPLSIPEPLISLFRRPGQL